MNTTRIFTRTLILFLLVLFTHGIAAAQVDNSRRNAITRASEKVSPAVVGINATVMEERRLSPWMSFFYGERVQHVPIQSLGSGFIISSDGYILTNDHVAGRATEILVTMTDGRNYPAELIGTDPITDITLLKLIDQKGLPFLEVGNSDDVIVGEWSIAFGNPFGLFSASAKPTVTVGVISATHVFLEQREGRVYRNMLQTDAAINSGNSGGPLVNCLGQVIGINTVIYTPNQGSVGLGFAIPINRVKTIVNILKDDGLVNREFSPGFRVQPVDASIAEAYALDYASGVLVTSLKKSGNAEKSGLEVADVIMMANGERILHINDLEGMIRYAVRGETIEIKVLRNGKTETINLELEQ